MKIDLAGINTEQFRIKKFIIAGETCFLVNPYKTMFDWDTDNLIFRSSVWNADGEPVSLSYKKFFNLNEKPALTPSITDDPVLILAEKIDGSTLIVSRYRGQTIIRTRRTVDARETDNGYEIDIFQKKYSEFFRYIDTHLTSNFSYIFEWVSPNNRIIMKYPESKLYLTGIIDHSNYSLLQQEYLNEKADKYGFERPNTFQIDSQNLDAQVSSIQKQTDIEGMCIYFNQGQDIRKCKTLRYLKLHALKRDLSLKRILQLLIQLQIRDEESFIQFIEKEYDYECASAIREIGRTNKLFEKIKQIESEFDEIMNWVKNQKDLEQKSFAQMVRSCYNQSYQQKLCFFYRKGSGIEKIFNQKILELADTSSKS